MGYIDSNFSSIQHLLWFPLCAAVFYVLALPYLSLVFELLLKTSLLKRNEILINRKKQNIDNEKQFAIEEIKLEEAKIEYRERNKHNKLVEELQVRNNNLEQEIASLNESNRSIIEELKSQLSIRDKMTKEEVRNFEKRYSDSRKEIKDLNEKLFGRDQEIQDLRMILNNRELYDNDLKDDKLNRGIIIRFENGMRILEKFDGNKAVYTNLKTNEMYSNDEVKQLMEEYPYERYYQ